MTSIHSASVVCKIALLLVFTLWPAPSVFADFVDGPVIRINDVSRFIRSMMPLNAILPPTPGHRPGLRL